MGKDDVCKSFGVTRYVLFWVLRRSIKKSLGNYQSITLIQPAGTHTLVIYYLDDGS